MTHNKACPCSICKSSKPPLWWIDFNAEKQILVKDGISETFEAAEARAVRAFSEGIQEDIDVTIQRVTQRLAASIRSGDLVTMANLQSVIVVLTARKKEMIQDLVATAKPYAQIIVEAGMSQGAALLRDGAFDLGLLSGTPSERVIEATARSATRMARSVERTLAERIKDIIRIGIEDNLTGRDVSDLLEDIGLDPSRSETIARTESARAYSDGQISAWEDSGVVKGKKWLISPQACEFCVAAQAMYGSTSVSLDSNFFENGAILTAKSGSTMTLDFDDITGPPLHPNCRCTIIPELDYSPEEE
jgi:hypothetical protein